LSKPGAAVVVWRRGEPEIEFLLLHRAIFEPGVATDWAWGPPSGGRLDGETPAECARRELREETGIETDVEPTPFGNEHADVFQAEVPSDTPVVLTFEHDSYRWATLAEARELCLPAYVGDQLARVAAFAAER
jgi:8-oxo-dGTP pyrophosphatase MutT (NUDIX family)